MLIKKPLTFEDLPNRTQLFFIKSGYYSANESDLNGVYIPKRIYENNNEYDRKIIQSDEPHTLLSFACHKHNPAIVKELLSGVVDVNQINGQGNPPLYYLINKDTSHSSQICHILQKLLKEDEIDFTIRCADERTILDHILVPNHSSYYRYETEDLIKIDSAEANPELELIMKAIADKIINAADFDENNYEILYPYFGIGQNDDYYHEFMDCLMDWHELSMEEKAQGIILQEDLENLKLRLEAVQKENLKLHNEISHLQEIGNEDKQPSKTLISSSPTPASTESTGSLNTNSTPKNA